MLAHTSLYILLAYTTMTCGLHAGPCDQTTTTNLNLAMISLPLLNCYQRGLG